MLLKIEKKICWNLTHLCTWGRSQNSTFPIGIKQLCPKLGFLVPPLWLRFQGSHNFDEKYSNFFPRPKHQKKQIKLALNPSKAAQNKTVKTGGEETLYNQVFFKQISAGWRKCIWRLEHQRCIVRNKNEEKTQKGKCPRTTPIKNYAWNFRKVSREKKNTKLQLWKPLSWNPDWVSIGRW